ncbi:MAG: GTP cyclohydrolase FolE2 [Bradymonadia bacterium]
MEHIAREALVDHASEKDSRDIPLNRVGIRGLEYPIQVLDKGGKYQSTVAHVGVYVSLPAEQRGTHMSRLVECIHRHRGEMTIRRLPEILNDIQQRLDAPSTELHLRFPYFIEKKAPISGVPSLLNYQIDFWASLTGEHFEFTMKVEVPVKSLCPCSKGISDRGAHNQRSIVSVDIKGTEFVWIEDLVAQVEAQASAPLFALLKREDEKYVTELAYDQAKFAEDLARDSLNAVRQFGGVHDVTVIVENFESIHNHQAYAEVNWTAEALFTKRVPNEFDRSSTPTEPESFGSWLKATREARNVGQSTLAKQLKVTPSYLSKLEADLRAPSSDLLEKLARVTGVSSSTLYLRAGRLPPALHQQAMRDPQRFLKQLESQ